MPEAVGRHFSPNGDRVSLALMDEDRVRDVLARYGAEAARVTGGKLVADAISGTVRPDMVLSIFRSEITW